MGVQNTIWSGFESRVHATVHYCCLAGKSPRGGVVGKKLVCGRASPLCTMQDVVRYTLAAIGGGEGGGAISGYWVESR